MRIKAIIVLSFQFVCISVAYAACNSPSGPVDHTIKISIGKGFGPSPGVVYLKDRVPFSVTITDPSGNAVSPEDLSYKWTGGTRVGSRTEATYTTHFSSKAPNDKVSAQKVSVLVDGDGWECSASASFWVFPFKINYYNKSVAFTSTTRCYENNYISAMTGKDKVTSVTRTVLEGELPTGVAFAEPRMNLTSAFVSWEYSTKSGCVYSHWPVTGRCYGNLNPTLSEAARDIDVTWGVEQDGGASFLKFCKQQALSYPNNCGGQGGEIVSEDNPGFDESDIPDWWSN